MMDRMHIAGLLGGIDVVLVRWKSWRTRGMVLRGGESNDVAARITCRRGIAATRAPSNMRALVITDHSHVNACRSCPIISPDL